MAYVKFLLSLLCIGLFSEFNKVQAQEDVTGIVRLLASSSEDGGPLVSANVLLVDAANQDDIVGNCVTNEIGFCEIRDIEPNTLFEIRISYIGFASFSQEIMLEENEIRSLQMELSPEVGEIDELTVRGERMVSTGEVGVIRISNTDISRVPTPGVDGDLVSYLQTEPGVVTTGDRGGDIYIRGGTPDQNLILVDNLPITKPFHISNLFSAFSDQVVQSADVHAGGFGAEFSGVTSAILDINLRPGNLKEFSGNAAVSPYLMSMQLEGPIKKDRQSILFSTRLSLIEATAPGLTGEEVPLEFGDVVARYSIRADDLSCSITGIYTTDNGEIASYTGVTNRWKNTVLGTTCLAYDSNFQYPIETSAGFSRYENIEGYGGSRDLYSKVDQLYVKANLRDMEVGIPLGYGFGINFISYDIKLDEEFTGARVVGRLIPILNMYTSGLIQPNDEVRIEPGIVTQFSLDNFGGLEPRLRIAWNPKGSGDEELSLALGRYAQLYAGISNQLEIGNIFMAIQPVETMDRSPSALHAILAYEKQLGNFLSANVETYTKSYKNIPVSKWSRNSSLQLETAYAKGLSYGFDVHVKYFGNPFYVSLGYGWSKVTYSALSEDLGAWLDEPVFEYRPAHDQRHKFNAIFSYQFAGFTANARWELGSGKPYTQIFGYDYKINLPFEDPTESPGSRETLYSSPFGGTLPAYHRLDISLGRDFKLAESWALGTQLGVINAYDRRNLFNFDIDTFQRTNQAPLFPYVSVKLSKN
jgi:hypothetical protein